MIINSETGFGYVTSDGKVVQKLVCPVTIDVVAAEGTWTDVASQEALNEVVLFKYDANTLISWAMSQLFTAELIPHFAAFLDFANKATEASKANFLAYATAVSLTSTANTIINKAVELGAPITEVS